MIHLHYANRLENLIEPLARLIAEQQRGDPLRRVSIVIPNRVVEQFLKHRLAEAIGIAANLEFPFLRKFLAEVVEAAQPQFRILELEELELVLLEALRAELLGGAAVFEAPRRYVETLQGTPEEREFRTVRLARQLAWLFREYSIARRPMLQKWFKNSISNSTEYSATEQWQRHLWISTFDADGYLRREWKGTSEHDWILLPYAFDRIPTSQLSSSLPPIVHVFGLAYAGPAYLGIFAQIGTLTELHIYTMNPCREFWEDVERASRHDRQSWVRRGGKVGLDLERPGDPFDLAANDDDTPALRLWARPGREYIRMLNELTDCDFDAHFSEPDPTRPPSLLSELQQDFLNREPQRKPDESTFLQNDGSVRFLACPGIARETEIVANEIWSLLERSRRAREPIRLHQIAVLVPDALYPEYLPHLRSAFARLHQLPTNIVNRGASSESRVGEAIAMLLRLPLGRLTREELPHLMSHPALRGEEPQWETAQAGRWCEELGIFFGADADDLANTYLPRDIYHWDQGLRRLALGVFMGVEPDRDNRFFRASDSNEYLPYSTAQDELPAVAAFLKQARALLSDAIRIRSASMTLPEWCALLAGRIIEHIHADDPADERARDRSVAAIESIAAFEFTSGPVSYRIAHELISGRIAALESQLAQFGENGIAVGPLSALRSIPFRAIFLLGLNEAQFPERDRRDPMDLRSPRIAGDVSAGERDQYLFMETLLAARESICLSYVARDAKTGDALEPASVVRELQFILGGYVSDATLKEMTIEHPLSRYDTDYFIDTQSPSPIVTRNFANYDSAARRGALMTALRKDVAKYCNTIALPGRDEPIYSLLSEPVRQALRPMLGKSELPHKIDAITGLPAEISLPISALRKFLECPIQGAAQFALRIFEDDGEELASAQDEPVAHSILHRTTLLREVFWNSRGNTQSAPAEYLKAWRIAQLTGEAPAGPFADAAQRIDCATIEKWDEQARAAGCANLDQWHEVRMGRADEFANPAHIIDELIVPMHFDAPNGMRESRIVRIHGSLGFIAPVGDAALRLVLRDKPRAKDFLMAFLTAMVLTATGKLSANRFHAIVAGSRRDQSWHQIRTLNLPTVEQARDYLSELTSDLLFGNNHYFLPIEAVEDIHKDMVRAGHVDLVDLVNEIRDNEFAKCSSDYGPIRDARRFEPPTAKVLKEIFQKRFGLIRALFDRRKD